MRVGEWEALRETRLRALADAPDAFGTTRAEALARPEEWWRDWAALSASGPTQAMFLAWVAGEPVGMAGVFQDEERFLVISMWTHPERRGVGVGRALLDAVVAFAGDAEVVLSVTEGNDSAWRLYEGYGFVPTGFTEPLRSNPALQIRELRLER